MYAKPLIKTNVFNIGTVQLSYDPSSALCCDGNILVKQYQHSCCCGNQLIDAAVQCCRNGVSEMKPITAINDFCCS